MEKNPEEHEKETHKIGQTKLLLLMPSPRRNYSQNATPPTYKNDHQNNLLPGQQGKQTNTSRIPTIYIRCNEKRRKRRGKATSIQTKTKEEKEKEELLNTKSVHLKHLRRKGQAQ